MSKDDRPPSFRDRVRSGLRLGGLVLALLCIRSSVAAPYRVPTASMEPTIIAGDRIYVNKLAYDLKLPFLGVSLLRLGEPARGEVVLFQPPGEEGIPYVKRVIGVPGDRISMEAGRLKINGVMLPLEGLADRAPLDEASDHPKRKQLFRESLGEISHLVAQDLLALRLREFPELEIPADNYFVMGDNRDNSADSRVFGFVPRDAFLGRASIVYASVRWDENGFQIFWDRFFKRLG